MARRRESPKKAKAAAAIAPRPVERPAAPLSTRHRRLTAAGLFAILFVVYVCNFRLVSTGDAIPSRLLPFSILREGNLNLDEFPSLWTRGGKNGKKLAYYVRYRQRHLYSGATIATPLVVTPLYVLPALWLSANDISVEDARARVMFVVMERISVACLAALSAGILFLVLNRLTTWRWALILAATYGLGTSTWSISSQALWPHALCELAIVSVSAVLLTGDPSRWALVFAGLMSAVAVANRPQMIGFAALALIFVWRSQRRAVLAFLALPAMVAAGLVVYNLRVFQGLAGAYMKFDNFSSPLFSGLAGLLVSPNRGLFIFTPIMIFAFWGAVRVWRVPAPTWMRYLVIVLGIHLLMHATFREWWAGYAFGPRYLTDMLPILSLLLVYGLVPYCRTRVMQVVAAVLIGYGVVVQAIGVYYDDDSWNRLPIPLEHSPQRVWDWSDMQIKRAARGGFHGGELWPLIGDAFSGDEPILLTELDRADLATQVRLLEQSPTLTRNGRGFVDAEITNRGGRGWPAFSGDFRVRYLVKVVVRWLAGGQPVSGVGDVLNLPKNLSPGESVRMEIPLGAPARPGSYEVEIVVVQALDGSQGISSADTYRFPVTVR